MLNFDKYDYVIKLTNLINFDNVKNVRNLINFDNVTNVRNLGKFEKQVIAGLKQIWEVGVVTQKF